MNPNPLSSLNHFTVPVAILLPSRYVHCETRRVHRGNNCENAGHGCVERTLDLRGDSSGLALPAGHVSPVDACLPTCADSARTPSKGKRRAGSEPRVAVDSAEERG